MRAPPNIDEIGNLVLLRQALDILRAPDGVQQRLYPSDRDPATEMRLLFKDAWRRVRPVFWPLLPGRAGAALDEIDRLLAQGSDDWEEVRRQASLASAGLPGADAERGPRPWLDQILRSDSRLRLRRQIEEVAPTH